MIFLAGSVLFFGGMSAMLIGVFFDWSERAVKLSSVAWSAPRRPKSCGGCAAR